MHCAAQRVSFREMWVLYPSSSTSRAHPRGSLALSPVLMVRIDPASSVQCSRPPQCGYCKREGDVPSSFGNFPEEVLAAQRTHKPLACNQNPQRCSRCLSTGSSCVGRTAEPKAPRAIYSVIRGTPRRRSGPPAVTAKTQTECAVPRPLCHHPRGTRTDRHVMAASSVRDRRRRVHSWRSLFGVV